MLAAIIVLGAIVIALHLLREREHRAWAHERHDLMNRVQHPGYIQAVPSLTLPEPLVPQPEPDEFEQVGTIRWDPPVEAE